VNLLDEGTRNTSDDILSNYDVLCVGDMLYDVAMGEAVLATCRRFLSLASPSSDGRPRTVYLGDPGRWVALESAGRIREQFPHCVAQYRLPRSVQQENSGFTVGHVWRTA
jgi:hypothetical protein